MNEEEDYLEKCIVNIFTKSVCLISKNNNVKVIDYDTLEEFECAHKSITELFEENDFGVELAYYNPVFNLNK